MNEGHDFQHFKMACLSYARPGTTKDGFSGQFLRIFEIIIFCSVVDVFYLEHDVEAIIFHLL